MSTFDTNIMSKIAPFIARGQDGKTIIENGVSKLNVSHIPCRCGFSLKVKTAQKKDGSGSVRIQEVRCYRLEITAAQPQNTQQLTQQPFAPQAPFPPQQTQQPFPPQQEESDDLPF